MSQFNASAPYAGDVSPADAWRLLKDNPAAQMVDVRTLAEWNFVGLPDLSSVGREIHRIEWQSFPAMGINPEFVTQVSEAITDKSFPIFFICRSGARSRAAATAVTRAGYTQAYNIDGGFEGDLDAERHRGHNNGWKASNLPWRQS